MSEQVLLLSADPWSMTDENTGELRTGCSLTYVNRYRDGDNGLKPTKLSAAAEIYATLKGKLPAVASLDFRSRPGKDGKATLTVSAVKLGKSIDLDGLLKA